MDYSKKNLANLNEIERLYLYNLEQIDIHINKLIKKEQTNNIERGVIINRRSTIKKQPYWHEYLMQAYWALSGDYPDEETEDNAVLYGNKMMLEYCMDELRVLPIDLLEDAQQYIRDHYIKDSCVLCDIKK